MNIHEILIFCSKSGNLPPVEWCPQGFPSSPKTSELLQANLHKKKIWSVTPITSRTCSFDCNAFDPLCFWLKTLPHSAAVTEAHKHTLSWQKTSCGEKKKKKPASSTEVSAVSQFVTFYAISVLNFSLVGRVERAKLRFCVLNNNMERVLTLSYYSSDFNKTCAAPLVKAERSMVRWPCFTWENLLNRIFFFN